MQKIISIDKKKRNKLIKALIGGYKMSENVVYALLEIDTNDLIKIIDTVNIELMLLDIVGIIRLEESKCWFEFDHDIKNIEKINKYASVEEMNIKKYLENSKKPTFLQKLIATKNNGSLNYNSNVELSANQIKILRMLFYNPNTMMSSICYRVLLPQEIVYDELKRLNNYLITKECGRVLKANENSFIYENIGEKYDVLYEILFKESVSKSNLYECDLFQDSMNLRVLKQISECKVQFTNEIIQDLDIKYESFANRVKLINVLLRAKDIGEIRLSKITSKIDYLENGQNRIFDVIKHYEFQKKFPSNNNAQSIDNFTAKTAVEKSSNFVSSSNDSHNSHTKPDYIGLLDELLK